MEPLRVSLFGGFQLQCGDDTVPPMPSRAARSLFGYLVLDPGTSHLRERIAAEFWPDLPAARARRRLSHTLWQVQDALGELVGDLPYLQVTTESIGFDRELPFWVDVGEFERGLDRARAARADDGDLGSDGRADLERTVELYRGEFLAGHYDAWIAPQQDRLHQRYLEALSWLVAASREQGAFEDALVHARRLTNEDPLREDGHREVMRLSVLLGRTSDAIRQYERCVEVLSAELGTAPSAATRQLHERILRRRSAPPPNERSSVPAFPDRVPLVGRAHEREAGITLLERALGGRGGALLVEGEPGLGKSRLLAEAVDDAHWRSFVTLHASCRGPEPMAPYTLVQELLEDVLTPLRVEQLRPRVDDVWLREAARLVPVLGRAVPDGVPAPPALRHIEGAQRLRDALVSVLAALPALDPLAIVVDDLQWADVESLEVLIALAGELPEHRAALLVGYRGDEARARSAVWAAIRDIDRRLQPTRVLLEPFDADGVDELARALARRHVSTSIAEQLWRETGGNPLFLMETVRTLSEQDQLALLEAEDGAELPLPGSIRLLLLDRLQRLTREAREVLDVAAVVGDGVDLDLLTDATELPREVVVDAADALVRAGLFTQTMEALQLRHHQVRRTALEELSAGRAAALHGRVAGALQRSQPHAVERLAHHFTAADRPREAVGYLLEAAGNATAVHAYAAADGYLRRAAEQQQRGPVSVQARFDLLARHEAVLDVLGDRDAQSDLLAEMDLLADDDRHHAEVSRRRSALLAHRGELEEAIQVGHTAVEQAGRLGERSLIAAALMALGTALLYAGRNPEAVEVLGRAAELSGEPAEEAEVRTTLGNVQFRMQRYDDAERELEGAARLARSCGAAREEARALGTLGSIQAETGQWRHAVELHERASERCEAIGFRYGQAANLLNLANAEFNLGRPGRAMVAYASADSLFASLGDQRGLSMVRMNRGLVANDMLGSTDAATDDLTYALHYFEAVGDAAMVAQCCDGLAGVALRSERLDDARTWLDRGYEALPEADDAWALAELQQTEARLQLRAGRPHEAKQAIEGAIQTAREHRLGSLLQRARTLEGEVLLELGDAAGALRSTAAATRSLEAGHERGYLVRYQHHRALAATGHEQAADAALRAARDELMETLADLGGAAAASARAVPEHARILAERGEATGERITIRVASASAPTGRPLRPAELVTAHVDLGEEASQPDDPVERRRWQLQRVVDQVAAQGGAPTVGDLAAALEVSPATIRRDLAALRGRGDVVPTRGHRAG